MRLNSLRTDPLNYIAKILLNSLYGRFGMDDNFNSIEIIHKDFINDFENKFLDLITDKVKLGEYFMVFYDKVEDQIIEDDNTIHNVSIAIAAAITAYARIHMSQFKNNPLINLYYSDTDSIYVDKPLPEYMIESKVLGKLNLEYICKNAIFLSPKVYYLETIDGKVIYKVKGLKHEVELTLTDFKSLLYKDSFIEKSQKK
jgi:DNA polymerase elongation subunit (family B)